MNLAIYVSGYSSIICIYICVCVCPRPAYTDCADLEIGNICLRPLSLLYQRKVFGLLPSREEANCVRKMHICEMC